jgi:putative membrane protein
MHWMGDMGWWMVLWGVFWGLVALALLVLIVLGIVWLARDLFRPVRGRSGYDPAEADLRGRYARGEIDRDEYLRRLVDLHNGARPPSTGGGSKTAQP